MIEVREVSRSFGSLQAVRSCSFSLKEGDIFGLLGPDGAGKTTLLRMIAGVLLPESGKILTPGFGSFREFRQHLGYMPQHFSLYDECTVEENITLLGRLYGIPEKELRARRHEILSTLGLLPFRKRLGGHLSGGMKQKLALGAILIHGPEVLLLDEPSTGVDPVSRREFWGILYGLNRRGMTILLSTAYMEEASLCSRLGFLSEGRLLIAGTPKEIRRSFPYPLLHLTFPKVPQKTALYRKCAALPGVRWGNIFGESLHLAVTDRDLLQGSLARLLEEEGSPEHFLEEISPNLEDVFVELASSKENVS